MKRKSFAIIYLAQNLSGLFLSIFYKVEIISDCFSNNNLEFKKLLTEERNLLWMR